MWMLWRFKRRSSIANTHTASSSYGSLQLLQNPVSPVRYLLSTLWRKKIGVTAKNIADRT